MWWVFQIGAREHYAVPRALAKVGLLGGVVTDFWVPSGSRTEKFYRSQRMRDRYHPELSGAGVQAFNLRMGAFEAGLRLRRPGGMRAVMARNERFQRLAVKRLRRLPDGGEVTVFSYSYAAREIFRYARTRGWQTVLGQIDPGPEEERIVREEWERESRLKAEWEPAPERYWKLWREEVALSDHVLVNSEWSRECLGKDGVPGEKLHVLPLVFSRDEGSGGEGSGVLVDAAGSRIGDGGGDGKRLRLLFLGQINLRKGVARLLEAMRLLRDEPVELILAGPSAIDPSAWADLPAVKWVGAVPRSRVAEYYRDADLFILPTLSDGYALTQLEAMSHGLPVLASRYCGEAVLAGENGFIIEEVSAEGIAAAIRAARGQLPLRGVRAPDFTLEDLGRELRVLQRGRRAGVGAGVRG